MKKILNFVCILALCTGVAHGAVRDGDAVARGAAQKSNQQRVATTVNSERTGTRVSVPRSSSVASRTGTARATATAGVKTRAASAVVNRADSVSSRTSRAATSTVSSRAATRTSTNATPVATRGNTVSAVARAAVNRAAIDESSAAMTTTRVGSEYEQCKAAYFACMDQFCQLKNDDYRRCSCSNRVLDLIDKRQTLTDAGQQLTTFTENLDVVGMTAAQATAMRTASEGEKALGTDGSASKALLQAIMNSIRGEDATVGGKMSDLNSINISFDATNAFGTADAGQIIATYNGQNLYSAVYPQCRKAVADDCNDASLQRAITAYLMAVEQDCNTVQTAIENTQKQLKSSVREGSAMLDLARVENRKNHNSSDLTTCIAEIESAVLSEEVCGAGYRKCLDNGEFIDITTGSPIAGVSNFYELGNLLTFATDVDAADQQLSKVANNRTFVQNFENRVKKFAKPALDKCVENADDAWAQYLDKALLDIFYAQKSKVNEIKQGCFDFVAACYMNADNALTSAMKELTTDASLLLQPGRITLTSEMCTDYINSCSSMFAGDIVSEYINSIKEEDATSACRAIAQQCFTKFGGSNYENFYYPYSGLSKPGEAMDWFSLYEITDQVAAGGCPSGQVKVKSIYDETVSVDDTKSAEFCAEYKSPCAQQLKQVAACSDQEMMEKVFGGTDYVNINNVHKGYGIIYHKPPKETDKANTVVTELKSHQIRSIGVATEVYNQIIDTLSVQCNNLDGRFVPAHQVDTLSYDSGNYCKVDIQTKSVYTIDSLTADYYVFKGENMCPREYSLGVDVQSWGACLCWENGGRRSKNGTSAKCMPVLPTKDDVYDGKACGGNRWTSTSTIIDLETKPAPVYWCTVVSISKKNQVCANGLTSKFGCKHSEDTEYRSLPEGIQ